MVLGFFFAPPKERLGVYDTDTTAGRQMILPVLPFIFFYADSFSSAVSVFRSVSTVVWS